MRDILRHINGIDGVIGSALFSHTGEVFAHAFPPLIEEESLTRAAALTLECTHGLQISQTLDLLDLRYSEGRVFIKAFPGALLFLLCTNGINLHVLSITLNLAVKKLGAQSPDAIREAVNKTSPGTNDGILRITISHLANKQASASFDSLGMIALSHATYQYISRFHNSPFKKLTLVNAATEKSGTFPVMVMKDMELQYDGTVVVGPGIEKKLGVREGDTVEVRIG